MKTAQILVCDDSPEILEVLTLMLNLIGLKEIPASNGKEALALMETFRPDLVISDINMPVMGGLELVKSIRKDRRLAAIPCVLMSSYDLKEEALRVGDRFLAKPFTLRAVHEVVESALYSPA